MVNRRKILLVEDEFIIAMNKQKELEKYGYNVIHINNGEKAVSLINEKKDIDLILMDIDLGKGIDGTEAAELILEENDIPIIFLLSHTESVVVDKTEKITSYGYVVKNSCITVLDASIKMAFKLFMEKHKAKIHQQQFENLIEQSPIAIQIISSDGRIINGNTAFTKLYNLTHESLIEVYEKYNLFDDNQLKKLNIIHLFEKTFKGETIVFP